MPLSVLFSLVFFEQHYEKIHITMYYNTEIFLLVVGKSRSLTLCGSFQVVSCSLQVVSGRFLLAVGRFRSFLARCRSFQVVFCSLQTLSGRFLLTVGRFRWFLSCFRSFQVVFCSLQVVSDRFLLVVGRFSSFQLVSCSLYLCDVYSELNANAEMIDNFKNQ